MIRDKHSWILVSLCMSILIVLSLLPHANAFKAIDQAMCKYVDPETHECKERTNQFDLADEWAFFWFRGTVEASDVGAKWSFNIREPDDRQFVVGPFQDSLFGIAKPGETVGWMGIGVSKANMTWGLKPGLSICCPTSIDSRTVRPASEKPGEWRVEFMLDGQIVVSERFGIGETSAVTTTERMTSQRLHVTTSPATIATTSIAIGTETQPVVELPINPLMIGGSAAIVVIILVAGYMYLRGKRS